ncbi:hypothetical protein COW36_02350 [bacterium (Candidatus Blackallbacteria) CG17_big_fil_post_rev_8_21_14_2_50_48_46]|uniref:Uncharacterized protein n=1 Tax=bacterium (Candidatus Blackallbacteria) CG17_big_fil_post_rev_8_21_14_2_50_48_46 TaxID=2014261 RepID=A0A2M7GA02_9BACT|nr:MAG: hypothetical protein COW64_13120 [bacterium (Candidatus Blackallbacteria) CG18_big_fil_WC_8_21_14_2_50_49_26]PIW18970.1 MAG: hypothetical protein COW36_02350 [bacterium (Candidatus Blackallbacteria) CG17_big_fil_post_rev_8_21_14_2_50_48_46]PIW44662.1 MAG: hypothetical protein COW20_23765 [bacterium (Candidatus Blackallbacteria) CG13_big_fil_rev_8_21_14_2_50_49_14]
MVERAFFICLAFGWGVKKLMELNFADFVQFLADFSGLYSVILFFLVMPIGRSGRADVKLGK